MYFWTKNILKHNYYYILKHIFNEPACQTF